MRTKIILASGIGLTVLFLSIFVVATTLEDRQQNESSQVTKPIPGDMAGSNQLGERPKPIPEEAYGPIVSIEEARSKSSFQVLVPSKLPGNVTLQRVRMTTSHDRVTLFYSGGFAIYENKITSVENFNGTRAADSLMKAGPYVKRFSYAGVVGAGVDPQPKEAGKPDLGLGDLVFWRDNLSYDLQGPFTFAELRDTAISMLQP